MCETKLLTFCVLSSVWNHLPRAVNYSEKKNRTLFRKKSKISKKIQRKITLNPNKIHRYPKSRAPFEGATYPSKYETYVLYEKLPPDNPGIGTPIISLYIFAKNFQYLIGKQIVSLKNSRPIFSRSKFQSLANNNNRKQRVWKF